MQFRVMMSGNTISLDPLPLDPKVPPLILGGAQAMIVPPLSEFVGQLFAVTTYEGVTPSLGYTIEYEPQPRLRRCLIGRLALEWADMPIIDTVMSLVDERDESPTWIQLDRLLRKTVEGSVMSQLTVLSVGTQRVLEILEASVKRGEFDVYEKAIEAVLRLEVTQSELMQHAPHILALIPEIVEASTRHREQLDATLRTMAEAQKAAEKRYEENVAAFMRDRTMMEAFLYLHQSWLRAQSVE